jgi:hypothetical protein
VTLGAKSSPDLRSQTDARSTGHGVEGHTVACGNSLSTTRDQPRASTAQSDLQDTFGLHECSATGGHQDGCWLGRR